MPGIHSYLIFTYIHGNPHVPGTWYAAVVSSRSAAHMQESSKVGRVVWVDTDLACDDAMDWARGAEACPSYLVYMYHGYHRRYQVSPPLLRNSGYSDRPRNAFTVRT